MKELCVAGRFPSIETDRVKTFDVNLVTCRPLPEPDLDEAPLLEALAQAGVKARLCVWDDPRVDWSAGRLTLIRSTWNYYHAHERFVGWAEEVASVSELHNPAHIVAWNVHKGYLLKLALRGIPVVPTALLEAGQSMTLASVYNAQSWPRIVVKPAVSAGSWKTFVMDEDHLDEEVFTELLAQRDVLIQPYIQSVDDYGERSLIFIDGAFSHCVRKHPRFADQDERITGPHEPTSSERSLAEAVLRAVGAPLLYARVDLVHRSDGSPMLAELEVLEPSLFFRFSPRGLNRFIRAIKKRL